MLRQNIAMTVSAPLMRVYGNGMPRVGAVAFLTPHGAHTAHRHGQGAQICLTPLIHAALSLSSD